MASEEPSKGFHLADGKGYMLSRNHAASSRLMLQYYLWYESLGFDLHPSIPEPKEGACIADLATGTGIWLLSLARKLSGSVRLVGLDISLDNAPAAQWLPHNMTLTHHDIFSDPSPQLRGSFDVVHLRLLILVVQKSDPLPIIRHARALLKPGGYIQWDDLDYPSTHVERCPQDEPSPAMDRLREFVYSAGRHDWVVRLDEILAAEGFEDCSLHKFQDRPDLFRANGDQHLLTMDEFVQRLTSEGMAQDAARVEALLLGVQSETARGCHLTMPRVVCVARKSLSED